MKKVYIYNYIIPMATKPGKVVTYIGGIVIPDSRNLLIT